MKQEYVFGGVGAVLGSVGTALQINEILQTISLVLTILGALVSFIIVPLLSWHRNAKKDGKINEEEFKEGCKHLIEGMQRTREFLEKSQTDKDQREEIKKERNNKL